VRWCDGLAGCVAAAAAAAAAAASSFRAYHLVKRTLKTAFIRTIPLFVYLDSKLFRAFLVNIRLALARYELSKKNSAYNYLEFNE